VLLFPRRSFLPDPSLQHISDTTDQDTIMPARSTKPCPLGYAYTYRPTRTSYKFCTNTVTDRYHVGQASSILQITGVPSSVMSTAHIGVVCRLYGVYETVRCPSVSVPFARCSRVRRVCSSGQEISIDCCSSGVRMRAVPRCQHT